MKRYESFEMYLETIYLLESAHGHAHSVDIAKRLGVSKPSVTKAMNQLKSKGLISKLDYGTITLTPDGRYEAERIYKLHRMLALYLMDTLSVSKDIAEENACMMEHILTDNLIEAVERYLDEKNISIDQF